MDTFAEPCSVDAISGAPVSRRAIAMMALPTRFVAELDNQWQTRSGNQVMTTLGISENTWRKLRTGQPIRASVAKRLLERFSALAEQCHPSAGAVE
jgi:hypothetical protein